MGIFQDALQLRACSLQVSCRCYAAAENVFERVITTSPVPLVAEANVARKETRQHQIRSTAQASSATACLKSRQLNYALDALFHTLLSSIEADNAGCVRVRTPNHPFKASSLSTRVKGRPGCGLHSGSTNQHGTPNCYASSTLLPVPNFVSRKEGKLVHCSVQLFRLAEEH